MVKFIYFFLFEGKQSLDHLRLIKEMKKRTYNKDRVLQWRHHRKNVRVDQERSDDKMKDLNKTYTE